MSDRDILEEMQKTGSQRYRPSSTPTMQAQTRAVMQTLDGKHKLVQRASRTAEQPLVRRTVDYSERTPHVPHPTQQQQQPRRTTQAYQQQRTLQDTNADVEVAPSVRRLREDRVPPTRQLPPVREQKGTMHWLVYVGIGMSAMLLVWLLVVQATVWWTNTWSDPGHYTQTAHLDTVIVTTDAQGHQSQARAFLDEQGHVDLLVLPTGDTSKARVVVGPTPSPITNPQKATITVTAKGTVVTILVQGPLEANSLATTRQTSAWIIDLKPASGKGGH